MSRNSENPALKYFTIFTAFSTLVLLCIGGLVTSHGAGMAVPDWPNTYGYNMFFFPVSQWIGGVFYEHSHRLVASAVGFFVLVLTLWLHGKKAQTFIRWSGIVLGLLGALILFKYPAKSQDGAFLMGFGIFSFVAGFFWPRGPMGDRTLRQLALVALASVILQGFLGGIRVTAMKDEIGIFHGIFAQMFFVLICAMALIQTRFWQNLEKTRQSDSSGLRQVYLLTTAIVLLQLGLGATMRHQHAGLAIPDFPMAYGKVWPETSPEAVQLYNQKRVEVRDYNSITANQIQLQMAHRIVAFALVIMIALSLWLTKRRLSGQNPLTKLALFWMFLVFVQFFLGASTIWTNKSADIATAHVAVGALTLLTGSLLTLVSFRILQPEAEAETSIPRFASVAAK